MVAEAKPEEPPGEKVVVGLFDCNAMEDDEVSFKRGDEMLVLDSDS